MKIAVSAVGPNLEDEVDPRFGRAPYIQIVSPDVVHKRRRSGYPRVSRRVNKMER